MIDYTVRKYEDVLAEVKTTRTARRVLLGNGFSRALRNDIFSYDALFEQADFSKLSPNARSAFERLETTDFERVMRALRTTATVLEVYAPDLEDLRAELLRDSDGLRELLASTIAANHPERPGDIDEEAFGLAGASSRILRTFTPSIMIFCCTGP